MGTVTTFCVYAVHDLETGVYMGGFSGFNKYNYQPLTQTTSKTLGTMTRDGTPTQLIGTVSLGSGNPSPTAGWAHWSEHPQCDNALIKATK
jgi:hypothetical protein